jgi:signal recognition particle receptor subunit beta
VHQGTVASMVENADAVQLPADKARRSLPALLLFCSSACGRRAASERPGPRCEQSGRKRSVRVVDVPGHPRVRSRFEQHADRACGVVFLLDAVDFLPHKTEVAEQLFEARRPRAPPSTPPASSARCPADAQQANAGAAPARPAAASGGGLAQVLTHPAVHRRRLPLLLACNKADQGARAHTVDFLRRRLERELEALRGTRGALAGDGGDAPGRPALAQPGQAFSFEALARTRGPRVSAAALSALQGDVASVTDFMRTCVGA